MVMDARTPPEYETWQTQYGEVQAVKVPQTVYEATVQRGYHHVGASVDQGGAIRLTPCTVRRRVRAHKRARALSEWLRRYSTELAGMLGDPPAWQLMPEKWGPQNVPEEVTTTVVGARVAKTTRSEICHTGEGVLEVDVKLPEGGKTRGGGTHRPLCAGQ